MNAVTTRPTRAAAVAQEADAIAQNVQKIEARRSALETLAGRLNVSAKGLNDTLRATAFKGANDQEFVALVIVANEYGLNPLLKEMYAFPQKGGGIVPMVSVDGWIRIMNSHPQFDGIEFKDIPDADGNLLAIEATIWRKDRTRPIRVAEYLDECKRNTEPWNKSPARMLRHRALIQCARIAFGFSGIHTDDEVEGGVVVPDTGPMPMRQAQRAEEEQPALPSHDAETGELTDEEERELDRRGFAAMEGRDDGDMGEAHATSDDLAEALGHLARKLTVVDVSSLRSAWMERLDPQDQDRWSEACVERIAKIKEAA